MATWDVSDCPHGKGEDDFTVSLRTIQRLKCDGVVPPDCISYSVLGMIVLSWNDLLGWVMDYEFFVNSTVMDYYQLKTLLLDRGLIR